MKNNRRLCGWVDARDSGGCYSAYIYIYIYMGVFRVSISGWVRQEVFNMNNLVEKIEL